MNGNTKETLRETALQLLELFKRSNELEAKIRPLLIALISEEGNNTI